MHQVDLFCTPSIPGDILAYLWLGLLQYKQHIHLFKGLVVNNAEGRGQFLSEPATAESSGRQFQKPVCLLSWLTLIDPCCSPAPPHKQTADDFIVCPLLSERRVQGVGEHGGERTSVAPSTHSIPLWCLNKTLQKSYICYSYSTETENIERKCKWGTILLVLFI